MSVDTRAMHSMRCDFPCSAELESYDGGAWLYYSPDEARAAAAEADWVHVDGRDYCPRHRDWAQSESSVQEPEHADGTEGAEK